MIQMVTGSDVLALLERVTLGAERYTEVFLCSPFIDDEMFPRLLRLAEVSRSVQCGVRVITSPTAARFLRMQLPYHSAFWNSFVVSHRDLHAKVYLAMARGRGTSEAIVTSANLTWGGVAENIELGIRVVSTSDPGRKILFQVRQFVQRLNA